ELIAGRRFFSTEGGLSALLHPRPPALRELRADCPPALEELVVCALSTAPEARFANAQRMHDALAAVRRAHTTAATATEQREREVADLVSEWAPSADSEPISARDAAFALTVPRGRLEP